MNQISTIHHFRCNLNSGPCEVNLETPLMHQDAFADEFCVSVWRGNAPANLANVTIRGYLYWASYQQTLLLTGSVDGSSVSVTLDDPCYAVPGKASLVIQIQQGSIRHTILKVNFFIDRTCTVEVIDPGNVIPTLAELLSQIDAMEQATQHAREAASAADDARAAIQADLAAVAADTAAIGYYKRFTATSPIYIGDTSVETGIPICFRPVSAMNPASTGITLYGVYGEKQSDDYDISKEE